MANPSITRINKIWRAVILLLVTLAIAGCERERTLTIAPAAQTPTSAVTATAGVTPLSPAAAPTATHTTLPTSTPMPPTATPTPYIPPTVRLPTAAALRKQGDYEHAVAEYAAVLLALQEAATPEPALAAEALFQLGETYYLQGDWRMVSDVFGHLVEDYPDSPHIPGVFFRLAVAHNELGEWARAAEYYKRFRVRQTHVAGYVDARLGDVYRQMEDDAAAADAYERALSGVIPASLQRQVMEELAALYRRQDRVDEAVSYYQRVLDATTSDIYKAQLGYEIGATYLAAGQQDDAAYWFRKVMSLYPTAYGAYQSLVALLEMDLTVEPLQRGIVNYHAGQYQRAIEVLESYMTTQAKPDVPQALLYIGLAQRDLQSWDAALATFEKIVKSYPDSDQARDAMFQRGVVLQLSADPRGAVAAYERVLKWYPGYVQAPEVLWRQAQLWGDLGEPAKASAAYESLYTKYPRSGYATRAQLLAGLGYYQAGEHEKARLAWETALETGPVASQRAALLFWIGKSWQRAGVKDNARARWQEAVAADPLGYYGLRAQLSLAGATPEMSPAEPDNSLLRLETYQPKVTGRAEAEAWLQKLNGTLGRTDTLDAARQSVRSHQWYAIGAELWDAGAWEEARAAFHLVQDAAREQPLALYALALDMQEQGSYSIVLACLERIRRLADSPPWQEMPAFLAYLAYPTHYIELLLEEAAQHNLDPRLFLALIRQESLFEARATSWAGARGLCQVMPSTGEWIASRLGQSRFNPDDLYRPRVSIAYGTWYLAAALRMFDGNVYGALAGYNGGPGNVERWAGGLPIADTDLFVERITAAEPKTYVMEIAKQYAVYVALYPGG